MVLIFRRFDRSGAAVTASYSTCKFSAECPSKRWDWSSSSFRDSSQTVQK